MTTGIYSFIVNGRLQARFDPTIEDDMTASRKALQILQHFIPTTHQAYQYQICTRQYWRRGCSQHMRHYQRSVENCDHTTILPFVSIALHRASDQTHLITTLTIGQHDWMFEDVDVILGRTWMKELEKWNGYNTALDRENLQNINQTAKQLFEEGRDNKNTPDTSRIVHVGLLRMLESPTEENESKDQFEMTLE